MAAPLAHAGRVLPLEGTGRYSQRDAGNVIEVTDALGRVTYSTYDERNRPVSIHAARVWDSVGGDFVWPQAVTTYDDAGRVTSVTDHTGAVVRKYYDAAGRLWKSTDPLNHATTSTYDPNGNVLTVTDALNRTVINEYDAHNRLKATQDAAEIVNEFEYDAAGNRTKVIDGLEQETTFVYDLLGRLTSQTFANNDTWTHTYNALHKTSQTDPNEVVTSYTYDARDRLLTSTAPGLVRTRSYDDCGRLLSVTEADRPEATVVNTYDVLGRLKTETSRGVPHTYFYDLVGNRVRAEYGTGQVVETSYDALNRPETITQGEQMTRYGYDLAGRAVMLIGGNGQVTENTYDVAGRLINRVLFRSLMEREQDDVMAEFGWAHDAVGNVVAQHEVWPGSVDRAAGVRATTMTYDGANRLETETITDPEQGVIATSYAYDAANNRDTKTVTGGSEPGFWDYSYNEANQLTAWEKRSAPAGTLIKSATLGYDDNGNRTSQTVTEVATTTTSVTAYHWDAQDRLSAVVMPDASVHSYDYDYRTRRTGTSRSGGSLPPTRTTIVFAGGLSLAEWETENSEPITANSPSVEYTRGPDMGGGVGGLLYSRRGDLQSPTLKYNLSNGRGDVVAQSDATGALTWTASYEAYGKRTKETGTNADKQRANTKDEDPTGLLNEGFRYRDIETGVWLSRDPAGFVDGPNLYAYVKQNPWTGWDPHGLKVEVKRTPKPAPEAPKGMTKMQKTDWDRRQRTTDHGSHTEITITAAMLDETSGGHTPEQLESMRQGIVDSVNKTFSGKDGKDSWSMKLDLRIVKSAKDIKDDDHELILKDFVMAKNFAGSEFGGYALRSDRQTESGSLGLGGNSLVLSMNSISNKGLNLGSISAHEFGHSMGLRHPDDKMNKFSRSTFSKDNLMWHNVPGSPAPVSKQQIDSIYGDYSGGKLNQGRSSISEVDFYFSEQQYQKEKQSQGGQP